MHRDLKPANLLLQERFQIIKLADFVLARVDPNIREGLSSSGGTAAFTFAYASPEQLRGDASVDGRSDLFSLGATLFHLATGRADTSRTFDLDEVPSSLTVLQPLLAGLLRASLTRRLPDVAAVLEMLGEITVAGASAAAVPPVAAGGQAAAVVQSDRDWSKILDALQSRVRA
ncbi:MAG: protein kinase domain-containing protein, partial [Planctomycetaceae bacterium]